MTDPKTPLVTSESELQTIAITLPGTKRPVVLEVPGDMTDSEWFSLVGMLPHIRDRLKREQQQPTIALPGGRAS